MERNFNNEFERFLKENADQYRMYPSSKVWNGIYKSLHSRRRWYGLGIALFLITGSLIALVVTTHAPRTTSSLNRINKQQTPVYLSKTSVAIAKQTKPTTSTINTVNLVAIDRTASSNRFSSLLTNNLSFIAKGNDLSAKTENHFAPLDISVTDELTDQDIFNDENSQHIISYPKSLSGSTYNQTIESVINSFLKRNKRFSVQFTLAPMISYRKLSANKSFIASAAAASAPSSYTPLYDINSVVTHKPDLGLEFGLTSKYALATNFKLRAGLQFNISRYAIKAFNSSYEYAKIDLKGSRGVDSVSVLSTHRNFSGYKSDWLQNFYFEVSMPVGVEVNIMGDDKVQFGVAGTIQPTYILGDRAYLLSTDYKNYAEVPWLTRRWNVNAGLETFVSYSTHKINWQVGPEVRYQLLSSFISKYPVKENLFDFGLRVGISLNK